MTIATSRANGPGFYEKLGVAFYHRLSLKERARYDARPETDDELVGRARLVTALSCLAAFLAGAIAAALSVYVDVRYENAAFVVHYGWLAGVTGLATGIEMLVLFAVSLRAVQLLARLSGHGRLDDTDPLVKEMLPSLLARAALEIPDPAEKVLGIDPLADISKTKLLLVSLLYKIKISGSNFIAKHILRRVLGRSVLRVSVSYVAVLITGMWNAFVLWKVCREARLRLFGAIVVRRIVETCSIPEVNERLSQDARLACVQAIGNALRLARRCHPNLVLLARRLAETYRVPHGPQLGEWVPFIQRLRGLELHERAFVCDLLAVAAALDGKLSSVEQHALAEAFDSHATIYLERVRLLTRLIGKGRLSEAVTLCGLDFELG